jgi:hypothetical protein
MTKHKIVIRFENGTIREVRNVPEHYTVQMFDYDIEKYEPGELNEDEHHRRCKVEEWPSEIGPAAGKGR